MPCLEDISRLVLFLKSHSLQLPRGTGKIKTQHREVPGLRRPFSRWDSAMKFTCTLTREAAPRSRAADCCGRSFHSSLKYAHALSLQVWTQVCSNDKNSNSRNMGKCPSEELQRDLASVDRCGQRSELGQRTSVIWASEHSARGGPHITPQQRAALKAEPLWPPAFSNVCGSGQLLTFSYLCFLSLFLSGQPPVPRSRQKGFRVLSPRRP